MDGNDLSEEQLEVNDTDLLGTLLCCLGETEGANGLWMCQVICSGCSCFKLINAGSISAVFQVQKLRKLGLVLLYKTLSKTG
jgi:hypothetical protein